MSKSVDQRIVEMKFENGKFKNDIKETIDSLEKLKKETDFSGVQDSAKNFDLSKIKTEVKSLNLTFKDVFKLDVFKRLADGVIDTFSDVFHVIPNLWNKTLNQIKTGGWTRATNIDQATFQLKGLGIAIEDVNEQINTAVEGTAYGYDQAAKAASQLATSQVKIGDGFKTISFKNSKVVKENVDEMERALGAISGIAAMTNSQFDDIADIFTDAAGRGKISADTFNRIAQRGLNSAGALAQSMGISEAAVKDLASKGKISFQEFADAMYETFFLHAKDANTTFEGSLSNMKAALSRLGQPFAKSIRDMMIGPFNELKETIKKVKSELEKSGLYEYFNKLTNRIGKVVTLLVKHFRLNDKNFEWVTNLSKAFENLVEVILRIALPIKNAFQSVFGDSIISSVNSMTKSFAKFIGKLKPSAETAGYIRIAFEGLFQIFKAIGTIIKNLISGLTGINLEGVSLLGWVGKALAIGLKVLGIIAELISKLLNFKVLLESISKVLNVFIKGITAIILAIGNGFVYAFTKAHDVISDFITLISSKVGAPSSNPLVILVREVVARIKEVPNIFPKAIKNIKEFFKSFNATKSVNNKFKLLFETLSKFKSRIGDVLKNIAKSIRSLGSDNLLTRFIASVVSGIGSLIQNVGDFAIIVSSVIIAGLGKAADSIKNFFAAFTDNMKKFNGNALLAFWKTFTEGLKNFISNIPDAVSGIKEFFAELSILDMIKDKFAKFVNWISEAINKIKDEFSTLGVVDVYAADFNDSVETITGSAGKTKWDTSGIQSFIDKLKEFVKNGGLAKVAILGINGALIAVIIQFARFLGSVTGLTKGLTNIVDGVKGILNGAKETPKINIIANAVLKLAASMVILVGALSSLTLFMEKHDISGAGWAMAALAGGILVFTTVLAILNKVCKLEFLFKFSKAMLVLSGSIFILVKAMNNIDVGEGILKRFGALAGLMGVLVGVSFLLSKAAPKLWKGSLSLLAFAAVIKVFTKVLDLIPSISLSLKDFFAFGATIFLMAVFLENAFNQFSKAIANMAVLCLSIAASAAILAGVVMKLGKYDGNMAKGLAFTVALVALVSTFGVLVALATKKFGGRMPKFNASLVLMAGSVAILAKVAMMIGEIPKEQLVRGVAAISIFLVLIGGLMAASALTEKAHPVKFAVSLMLITGCLAAILGLSALAGLLREDILENGVKALRKIMVMIAILMAASAFTAKSNYGSVIAAIIGVSVIMGEMLLLSMLIEKNGDEIKSSMITMGFIIAAFSGMMFAIGKGKYNAGTVGAMLSSVLVVAALGGALYLLATQVADWKSLIAPTIAIRVVLGIYTKMLNNLSKRDFEPASIKVLLTGALLLGEVGLALVALNAVGDWKSILASVFAINNVMCNLFNIMELLTQEKIDTKQIGNFLVACLSLVPVGLALSVLASQDWGSIATAGASMAATLWAMSFALTTLATWDFASIAGAAGAILIVSGAIVALAYAFNIMSDVNWPTVGLAVGTLVAITAVLFGLSFVSTPALIAAAAIVIVAAALDLISLAMIGAAYALKLFTPSLVILAGLPLAEIGNGLVPLAGGLSLLGLAGISLTLGAIGLSGAALYMSPLAKGLIELSKVGNISHIPGPLALIGAAGLVLGTATPGMLLAGGAFKVLATGITILGTAVSKAAVLISSGINLIVSTLKMGAANIKNNGQKIGVNVGAGMLNGIKASLPSVIKGAFSLADGIINTVKSALQIHSPSKVMQWLGKMCGVGFDEGSTDKDVWNGIKSKITSRINNSVLAPIATAVGNIKGMFNSLGSVAERTNNPLDKLPTNVQKLAERFVNASDSGNLLVNILHTFGYDALDTTEALEEMTSGADGLTEALAGENGNGGGGAAKAAETTKNAFEELKDKISGQMDIFSEFERKTEMTSDKLLANMQDQINGIAEWSKMMGDLAMRGINQGLLQKLADLGPQGYEYVHAFVTMTDEQLSQANQLYAKSLLMPEASANMIMNSFAHAGLWATQGFENGLDLQKFKESGVKGAQAVRDGLEGPNGLQINSPSKVMYENGRYAIAGFVKGIDNQNKISLQPKMITIAKGVVSDIKREAGPDKFREIGANIIRGLIVGIASKEGDLKTKVESIANTITGKFQKVLQIHSPSRVMARLGGFVTEGLAIGIEGNTELVANASENLASTAISGLKDAIKAATNLTDLGIDLNPTITPVLDLSNIEAGSTQLDNLTNGWNNVGISTSSTLASSAANSFNKTSMAKANMALETQNGLSLLKSAINSLESRESDEKLDTIVGMMTEFMPLIGQGQVVLDTGATVGALAPRMDAELGRRASMRGRHV